LLSAIKGQNVGQTLSPVDSTWNKVVLHIHSLEGPWVESVGQYHHVGLGEMLGTWTAAIGLSA